MTDQEIFIKILKKAKNNGFMNKNPAYLSALANEILSNGHLYSIIFSHKFAKAFWGEELWAEDVGGYEIPKWQYNLKRLVLEKEPLKYLEKFLDEKSNNI